MQTNQAFGMIPAVIRFPFKGEGWFGRLAIAALLLLAGMIIPIVPSIFLLGYIAEMIRRITVEKEDASMPAWDNWGKFFNDGLKMLGASLIITVPLMLIYMVIGGMYFLPLAFMESNGGEDIVFAIYAVIFILQFIVIFFSVLVAVLAGIFQPVYLTHMVTHDQFSAIFHIKEWWQIFKKSFWEFVVSFLLMGSLYTVVMYVTMIMIYSVVCCCLAPFIGAALMVYIILVYAALMAYAYRSGVEKLGEPVKPTTPQPETPAADFDLPEAADELEPAPAPEPVVETMPEIESPVEAVEPEPAAEATLVSTIIAEAVSTPETPELPETPALDATLVSEPVIADEVEAAESLLNEQATMKFDDLKKISGIGPKTAAALNHAGILTFHQLAELPLENLKQILIDAGLDILLSQCDSWSSQAGKLMK